jgi:hypothetical protein
MEEKNLELQAHTPAEQDKKRRPWRIILGLLVLIAGYIFLFRQIGSLENQVQQLEGRISSLDMEISNSIAQGIGRLENQLEEEASVLAKSSFYCEGLYEGKALLKMEATPKEYREGMTLSFVITGEDGTRIEAPATAEGAFFSASAYVPLWDHATFEVLIREGETLITATPRENTCYILSEFLANLDFHPSGGTTSYKDGILNYNLGYRAYVYFPVEGRGSVLSAEAVFLQNGTEILRQDCTPANPDDTSCKTYDCSFSLELPAQEGDQFEVLLEIKDDQGIKYTTHGERLAVQNGTLSYDSSSWGEMEWVYEGTK